MASSPETSPPSPPADDPPTSPPPPSESQSPPEAPPQSPPPSPPASPPPSPPSSSPPPPSSSPPSGGDTPQTPPPSPEQPSSPPSPPPPSTTNPSTPPVNSSPPSTPTPVFSPPPPGSSGPRTPPSVALPPPLPSNPSAGSSSSIPNASSSSSPPSSSDSSANVAMISGVLVGGVLIVMLVVISLMCSKRKRKPQYYMDQGIPPKGYNNGMSQWNNGPTQRPMDHIVKIPPPPMGGGGGSWGGPPSMSNNSNDFSNGSGQFHVPGPMSPNMMMGGIGGKSQFLYEELASATGGFSQANVLGQGGFGFVHKGILSNGREVAVKSLKSGSGQGEREFQAEVEIISRVHHRHLVSLVGYCIAGDKRMLVYEFVPNKTLEFHLHGKGQPVMDWASRVRIAMGSAKGLAYLHEDCHPRIIHRDIKAANILIDNNFEAMVADFGLAKLTSDNYTHVSTRVMGTFGYLAPEYAASGKLTEKSDVFSFGVMLLEIITGRRPVDPTNLAMEDSLVDWARPLLTKAMEDGDYSELVDPLLEGEYVAHEMGRMIASASACIRHSARRRPRMSQIVRALEGNASLDDLNEGGGAKPSGGGSKAMESHSLYDTGAYNADMIKFRKMVMAGQDSSEYGDTSEYGLNPSCSSSGGDDSKEMSINTGGKQM